jgi:hypothetical protein
VKQKKQLAVLVVLLLTAGVIWFLYFDRDKSVVTADASSAAQNYQLLSVENPQLHTDKEKRARETEYKSGGRNIFSRDLPPPLPSKEAIRKLDEERNKVVQQAPAPPPTVSPLPVKFFGFGTVPNGTKRLAFFTNGEDVYVVGEGELLLNRFRIIRIGNANLEYEEVSSGLRGTANLEDQGGPPSA